MGDSDEATVQQGSRVRIQDGDRGERVVRIRGDEPESWSADSIHIGAPLARALIGHRVGDEVTIELHAAVPVRRVVVLGIE